MSQKWPKKSFSEFSRFLHGKNCFGRGGGGCKSQGLLDRGKLSYGFRATGYPCNRGIWSSHGTPNVDLSSSDRSPLFHGLTWLGLGQMLSAFSTVCGVTVTITVAVTVAVIGTVTGTVQVI